MITIKEAYAFVKNKLKDQPKRLIHVTGVAQMAVYLNKINNLNLDENKLIITGLLHDAWKYLDSERTIKIIKDNYDINIYDDIKEIPSIWHGFVGAIMVQKELNITDEEIVNGICYHGVGRKDMSDFEKVIFISDYIELSRQDDLFDSVRDISYNDINQTVLQIMLNKRKYLKERGFIIYKHTDEIIKYYEELYSE